MGMHPSFTMPAQLRAAHRYVAAEADKLQERLTQRDATAAASGTVASAVKAVLRAAAAPLRAPEIRARIPEDMQRSSLGPTLLKLALRGDIRRLGREGKYRYTAN